MPIIIVESAENSGRCPGEIHRIFGQGKPFLVVYGYLDQVIVHVRNARIADGCGAVRFHKVDIRAVVGRFFGNKDILAVDGRRLHGGEGDDVITQQAAVHNLMALVALPVRGRILIVVLYVAVEDDELLGFRNRFHERGSFVADASHSAVSIDCRRVIMIIIVSEQDIVSAGDGRTIDRIARRIQEAERDPVAGHFRGREGIDGAVERRRAQVVFSCSVICRKRGHGGCRLQIRQSVHYAVRLYQFKGHVGQVLHQGIAVTGHFLESDLRHQVVMLTGFKGNSLNILII